MGKKKRKKDRNRRESKNNFNLRQKKRYCFFCKENIDDIDYKNVKMLYRYVSDKGKIRPRRSTGNCVQHQRKVATAVKRARELALLPYYRR